jgi:ABC-2 type transport system ATP-binding protein
VGRLHRHRQSWSAVLVAATLVLAGCSSDERGAPGPEVEGASTSAAPDVAADEANWAPPECDVAAPDPVATETVPGVPHDLVLTSFDDTPLRIHWFPDPAATAEQPSPTVLMGPGWGLAGDTASSSVGILGSVDVQSLRAAGYNVLTWDPRGFGRSGGVATVNDPEREGRDVQRMLDWVAEQPVARTDANGDPRVGMVGGSYGGGIQLVAAAIDCRVDAIVPVMAWHSLGTSLYRSETVKTGWAGILSRLPTGAVTDAHIDSAYSDGIVEGSLTDEDLEWFLSRGPGELVEQVRVPTLLIQGTVDTLFTLDEALTNLEILESNGVPSAMLWFCGGHGICLTDEGDPERVSTATLAWLDRWVEGDESVDTGPRIDLIVQTGDRYTASAFPEPSSTVTASGSGTLELIELGGSGPVWPAFGSGGLVGGIAAPVTPARAEHAVEVKVPFDEDELVIGSPRLTLTYTGTTPDGVRPTRVFAQLVDDATGHVLDNQVTPVPLELDGREHTVEVPMEVVSFAASAGGSVTLQVVATTVAYAQPRLGGEVELSRIEVALPVVDGLSPATAD